MYHRLPFLFRLVRAQSIARRYFVTNGFDGALAMLGIIIAFYASHGVDIPMVINACLGAAIALAVSGISSAYVSESAEREKELKELEQALVRDLDGTAHGWAARLVPVLIAVINGMAPLLVALVIMAPLWLSAVGVALPAGPLELSIAVAFAVLFLLGIFLGTVSGRFWLLSGVRTLLLALLTAGIILLVSG